MGNDMPLLGRSIYPIIPKIIYNFLLSFICHINYAIDYILKRVDGGGRNGASRMNYSFILQTILSKSNFL